MSVAIIPDFVKYQIEWLTSHDDLEFEPAIKDAIVQMLKDTGKSFIDEQAVETSQIDHIADSSKKVERASETAQNVRDGDKRKINDDKVRYLPQVQRYIS